MTLFKSPLSYACLNRVGTRIWSWYRSVIFLTAGQISSYRNKLPTISTYRFTNVSAWASKVNELTNSVVWSLRCQSRQQAYLAIRLLIRDAWPASACVVIVNNCTRDSYPTYAVLTPVSFALSTGVAIFACKCDHVFADENSHFYRKRLLLFAPCFTFPLFVFPLFLLKQNGVFT